MITEPWNEVDIAPINSDKLDVFSSNRKIPIFLSRA